MTLADYLKAQQNYLDALLKYKAALDRLKHYQAPRRRGVPGPAAARRRRSRST